MPPIHRINDGNFRNNRATDGKRVRKDLSVPNPQKLPYTYLPKTSGAPVGCGFHPLLPVHRGAAPSANCGPDKEGLNRIYMPCIPETFLHSDGNTPTPPYLSATIAASKLQYELPAMPHIPDAPR